MNSFPWLLVNSMTAVKFPDISRFPGKWSVSLNNSNCTFTVKCSSQITALSLTCASVCSVTVAGSQKCQPTKSSRSRERVAKARVAGAKPASRESSRQVCSWHIRRVTCCEADTFISLRTFGQRANSSAWNCNSNTQQTLTAANTTGDYHSSILLTSSFRLSGLHSLKLLPAEPLEITEPHMPHSLYF